MLLKRFQRFQRFLAFIIPDMIKLFLATLLSVRLRPLVHSFASQQEKQGIKKGPQGRIVLS
jgi:hypothetical protein